MLQFIVAINWAPSAAKHGVPRSDAVHAIQHAVYSTELEGFPGEVTTLYIGHPHPQTDRFLEVITALRPPRTLIIFHVMPLSDLYRHLLEEE